MNTLKNIGIGAVGVLFAVVVALTMGHTAVKEVNTAFGSATSPDIQSPYFSFGGVRQWAGSTDNLIQASTTICAIQSPAGTSTLEVGSIQLSVSSSTASTVTLAKSTVPNGSSTIFQSNSVSAGAQATITTLATTTSAGVTNYTFAPNTYFVVSMGGGTGTYSPTGSCKAIWVQN